MAFTQKLSYGLTLSEPGGAQKVFSFVNSGTDTGVISVNEAIGASTTNGLIAFTLDVSLVKSIVMWADNIISVFTNDLSSGSPAETFAVKANKPVFWDADLLLDMNYVNPFATDITAIYVTTPSGPTVNFNIRALYDSTV